MVLPGWKVFFHPYFSPAGGTVTSCMINGHTGFNNFRFLKAVICHPNIFNLHRVEAIKAKPKILQVILHADSPLREAIIDHHQHLPAPTPNLAISPASESGEEREAGSFEDGVPRSYFLHVKAPVGKEGKKKNPHLGCNISADCLKIDTPDNT